jgi:TolA-binding protein
MNWLRLALIGVLISPLSFGQKREYVELQRDVATLQDQVRSLERSFNEKMGGLTTLVQQTIDSINKLNTNVAVLDASMRDREKNLATPVTAVGSKVDQMSSEFQAVRVSIDDLTSRLGKLERGLVDLGNTMKVMQAPPSPPPGAAGAAGGPPQGLSAEDLYANAMRDKNSGNYDMAMAEFNDYLKFYGDTASAPNAQYYLGEIAFNRKDYEGALSAFNLVLERFPEDRNNKILDATYMKGRTLMQLGENAKAADEFRSVIRSAPQSDLAEKSKAQLKTLRLPVNPAGAKRTTKKR